jgi:hypothetical protein
VWRGPDTNGWGRDVSRPQEEVNIAKVDVPANSALGSRFDIRVSFPLYHAPLVCRTRSLRCAS